ncbi:unnamed protein product [Cylicostephanus goldi]|uniref:J domain-containing protein n=1 Tax=Cylicostephanus goldi TaxID=71465 RepID=A0A3P6QZD9_CYLGO|nr:unnamed protein product [Cylicostephanus goldi]
MGRASFEYDEVGNTFYYVLVSFYAIILIPVTYLFFPTGKTEVVEVDERECQCVGCARKRQLKAANRPWKLTKTILTVVALVIAWIVFALIVKKVTEIEVTYQEYNPYQILGLDQGADTAAVRKAYRELSKKMHPDRGGDAQMFDKIAKAYQALTDEESRENWEKYGNPDGPTATTFGIALPKWLVSKEYGLWVLAFYGLLFMVVLPVVVGIWWYNSIKYNVDKVLLDTTQLYYYFLHKTPKMEINRMLMLLGGSFEFWKQYNKDIVERETDDVELTRYIQCVSLLIDYKVCCRRMKSLPNLGENKKERPLSLPYSLKARILIHSYLTRIPLDNDGLEFDQR